MIQSARRLLIGLGLGAAVLANGVAIHPYGAVGEDSADYAGTGAPATEEQNAQNVLGGIPAFYITEFGYAITTCSQPSAAAVCSEAEQASEMQAAYQVFLADRHIKGIWWYQAHDDSTGGWGYLDANSNPRPSFATCWPTPSRTY